MCHNINIAIGSDHAGVNLKEILIEHLRSKGINVKDFGTNSLDSVDYPDYAVSVSSSVISKECDFGILICGTGIGISIAANKIKGIRAALCHDNYTARMSRLHNNANIIAMGANVTGKEVAKDMVDIWLTTEFDGGRHERRINKIDNINMLEVEE